MKGTKSFRTEKLGSESWAGVQSMLRMSGKIPGRIGLCYQPQAGPACPSPWWLYSSDNLSPPGTYSPVKVGEEDRDPRALRPRKSVEEGGETTGRWGC